MQEMRKCYNVIIHIQHVTLWRWRLPWRKRTWHHRKSENFQMSTLYVSHEIISQTVHERTIWNSLFAKKDTRKWDRLKSLFFYNNIFVSFEKFQLSVWNFSKDLIVYFTIAHLSVTKVARRSYHIWEECTMDFVNIITSETVFALDGQGAHNNEW